MKKRDNILGKISYACGDIYGGGSFLIVGLLLLNFFTNVEGLSGAWAGTELSSEQADVCKRIIGVEEKDLFGMGE